MDDAFEREADRVAQQVSGQSGPGPAPARAAPQLARAADGAPAAERPEPSPSVREASEAELTSGGDPLPPQLRAFYEQRLGRDLSGVRVHAGAHAAARASAIDAHAFTYANHVWLGAHQPVAPSFVLAHELAHVLQQTQPGATPSVQRLFDPYWVPKEAATNSGTFTHNLVLGPIARNSHALNEVPIPNAEKGTLGVGAINHGFGKRGFADLYAGKDANGAPRTVGVMFNAHGVPAVLTAGRGRKRARSDAAPVLAPTRASELLDKVDEAPVEIKLADLKPSHGSLEAKEGPEQLRSYVKGLDLARDEVNALSQQGKVRPAGASWGKTSFGIFGPGEIKVPPQFDSGQGQRSRSLVLIHDGRIFLPDAPVPGRVYVGDPKHGILSYVWIPDSAIPGTRLSGTLITLRGGIRREVIAPVISSPLSASPTAKAPKRITRAALVARPLVTADCAKQLRRRVADAKPKPEDAFQKNYDAKWRPAVDKYTKEFNAYGKIKDFKKDRLGTLALQAQQATHEAGFTRVAALTSSQAADARAIDEADFWTGTSVKTVGIFRKLFGSAFVTLYNLYVNVRERFRSRLRHRPEGSGGGLLGAALRVVFKLLKMVGKIVIGEVLNLLAESLVEGVQKKLLQLLPVDRLEELRGKVREVEQIAKDLENSAIAKLKSFVEDVLGPFEGVLKAIEKVRDTLNTIKSVVSLVRWGARVIACLSPPALGCLWIIGQAVLEKFASIVVETCWFQKKVAPYVFQIDYVRKELPRALARVVRNFVVGIFPGLGSVFAEIKPELSFDQRDVECGKDPSGAEMTPERQAILDLMERLRVEACGGDAECAEQLLLAYAKLSEKAGVSGARKLTPDEIRQLADKLIGSGLSAKQLSELADSYTAPQGGKEQELKEFLETMKNTPAEPGNPPPEEPADSQAAQQPPPGEVKKEGGAGAAQRDQPRPDQPKPDDQSKGGAGAAAAAGGAARSRERAVDASSITRDTNRATTILSDYASVVENPSEAHTKGEATSVTIAIHRKRGENALGALVVRILGVAVVVDARTVVKKGRAQRIDISYKIATDKPLDLGKWVPGAVLSPGDEVPGFIFK
ncbi:MAG TPA: DUF4157 domain-containing protein [Polyangiaceae bacterium]|nr:DUF4157 domain-containing protein [Polyangiaceae bacterium]